MNHPAEQPFLINRHSLHRVISLLRPCFQSVGLMARLILAIPALGLTALAGTAVSPDQPQLQYTGRIDFSNRAAPALSWPASSII